MAGYLNDFSKKGMDMIILVLKFQEAKILY